MHGSQVYLYSQPIDASLNQITSNFHQINQVTNQPINQSAIFHTNSFDWSFFNPAKAHT